MTRAHTQMEGRVTKAIAIALRQCPVDLTELDLVPVARAAIRAMREPTADMRKAIGEGSDCGRCDCFLLSYQDGIDAASPPDE